jgi:GNAT superfamily N-acetyltransferase
MNWRLNLAENLWLRRLAVSDRPMAVAIARRAFNSDEVAQQVDRMLRIYFRSSSARYPVEKQFHTLLPVSYFMLFAINPPGEIPVGLTGLYRPVWAGQGVFWLGWFAIEPAFQGRGYGKQLLQASMALARQAGGEILCIETSHLLEPAGKLYEKMGFQKYGQVPDYWNAGNDLVILARRLDDIDPPEEIKQEFPDG